MPRFVLAIVTLYCSLQLLQAQGPRISTEDGNVRIQSDKDIVLQASSVQMVTQSGEAMNLTGPPGPKGMKGERGPAGPQGRAGEVGAVISWNECTWENLNSGLDFGLIATCRFNKRQDDTWLRISWHGNMRITRCNSCCMRWYFTIDGEECSDPGPIDTVIFQSQNYHIVRQTPVIGSCRSVGPIGSGSPMPAGAKRIQFSIENCPGFGGFVYDAYTGWNSASRIIIEEMIPRDESFPEVQAHPPQDFVYRPHYCQYLFQDLGTRVELNVGEVAKVRFTKLHEHTVLRITWEGNFRKRSCTNCCSRWWVEVDGSPCDTPVETSISSSTAYNIFAPTTVTGNCETSGELLISNGLHSVRLMVGSCENFPITNTASGIHSTSRFIVDEIPKPRDPQLTPGPAYHPVWTMCGPLLVSEGTVDEGALNSTSCTGSKDSGDSSIRVTFNGNIRVTDCHDCCARWFVTLNGEECSEPGPIEAVVYSTDAAQVNIHRSATITGICSATSSGPLPVGNVTALLNIGICDGFNDTYNAFTGFNTDITMLVEEYPTPIVTPPDDGTFYPNWRQCVFENSTRQITASQISPPQTEGNQTNATQPDTGNQTSATQPDPIDLSSIYTCKFSKRSSDTSLKVSWDGNVALLACENCCVRWYVAIDGQECGNPGPIDAAIRQDLTDSTVGTFDLYRPITVAGICHRNATTDDLAAGDHVISLGVGLCGPTTAGEEIEPADVVMGYNSIARIIVEEIPGELMAGCDIAS